MPWRWLARPEQRPPTDRWLTWLILAGRGWGKTRTGAEWVQEAHLRYGQILLAGRTAGDLRDIMIEGPSGIARIAPNDDRPLYEPSKRRLVWPNGSVGTLRSADEPEGFRGLSVEAVWADELAAWNYPDAWDQLQLGFREGERPQQVVTTTPKPIAMIRDLIADPTTHITRGSTYDNAANLSSRFIETVVRRYEGTRLGRQELYAEILDDIEGALWRRGLIRYGAAPIRHDGGVEVPDFGRIVVAIDPAVTYGAESDETGIMVAGKGRDANGYVIDDLSGRFSPLDWAERAIAAYRTLHADAIVGEVNNGGDMVEQTLRSAGFDGRFVRVTASRGKRIRAEPIAGLYEQFRIIHLRPFPELEDQLCSFTPESTDSPDRLDALVWALTELRIEPGLTIAPESFSSVA